MPVSDVVVYECVSLFVGYLMAEALGFRSAGFGLKQEIALQSDFNMISGSLFLGCC